MKKNNFLLSIIMPCYNNEQYIILCLESIISQVNDRVQIIIINDGSTDKSDIVVENYLKNYKGNNILYKNQDNNGVSSARNLGLEYAEGDYITFVDSDDLLENNYWSTIEPIMDSRKYDLIDFKYHRFFVENGKIRVLENKKNPNKIKSLPETFALSEWHVWTRIIKKDIAIIDKFEIGKRYEDMLYTPYAYLRAKEILHLDDIFYLYRDNPDSITSNVKESDIHDIIFSIKKMINYTKQTNQEDSVYLKELTTYMIINCFKEVRKMHKKLYGYYNYKEETSKGIKNSLSHCDIKHINYKTYLQMRYNNIDKFISWIKYLLKKH